jgi:hypothetical protein
MSDSSTHSAPSVGLDREAGAGYRRIREDPAAFIGEWLGADLWSKQIEIAEAVRDHRRVAVKSCHGSGKSFLSARIVIWFLHAYPGSVVITTAPTDNQVVNILWREIGSAYAATRSPVLGRCLTKRYEIAPDWYALGFKAADTAPDRFQGFHAEHALVVIDEAAGVSDTVFEALDAVLTSESARLLLIGNPTNAAGTFYEAFHGARGLYHPITIAAEDTPNIRAGKTVRPYLITQRWIDDAVAKHGPDSDYVRCRVHARFPEADNAALIPLAWIEAADAQRIEMPGAPVEAGLDVARGGGDECSLCIRRGYQVLAHHSWSGPDTRDLMATVGRTRHYVEPYRASLTALKVDVVGIGAGVADRLAELGYPVVPVNAGAASSDPEKWQNLRCEMYWTIREMFRNQEIAGPLDDIAMGQGASVRYRYLSRYPMPVIESKDEAKRRGVASPDRFEALMLAFTNPSRDGPVGVWFA